MMILASTSKTRQEMLRNAGLSFAAEAPRVDERALTSAHPEWSPEETAVSLAEAKAAEVSARHPHATVIGADQVLALGQTVYSKPRDAGECREHLLQLRGKTHRLISGIAAARNGDIVWSHRDAAHLTMRDFSDEFLSSYLATVGADCTTSVGGYKIEGVGIQLFSAIEGDHFTILGLPLLALLAHLRQSGGISS